MKSAEDGNRMEKERKDEKEIICQKRWTKANMERITNNYLFFKTGFFFERREGAKNATTNRRKHIIQ